MLNIVLFGPPGAGKGTQSAKLIDKYGLVHLSTGDIFRANMREGTDLGNLAKSYIEKGQLVPDEVTIGMLGSELDRHGDAKGFIFDGFPRTAAQATALDRLLKSKDTEVSLMLALEVEESELRHRLMLRGQDSNRDDDKDPEVIQKRIDVYNSETAPVKDFYEAQGKYKGVQGIGMIEDIFEELCRLIDKGSAPRASAPAKEEVPAKEAAPKAAAKRAGPAKRAKAAAKPAASKKLARPNRGGKPAKKVKAATKKKTAARKKVAKLARPAKGGKANAGRNASARKRKPTAAKKKVVSRKPAKKAKVAAKKLARPNRGGKNARPNRGGKAAAKKAKRSPAKKKTASRKPMKASAKKAKRPAKKAGAKRRK